MKKKIILVTCAMLLMTGCGKDVKLVNGENAIVTFKEGGISSNQLYDALKETQGAEKIMNLIDAHLLDLKYDETDEEKNYVKQNLKSVKEAAGEMGASLEMYLSYYYGVGSEKAFEDYLALSFRRDTWTREYAKETITEKQINDYYEQEVYGDVEASHILITVDVKSDATDDEKKDAEEAALKKANDLIEKLKKGEDSAKLAKENSKDATTAGNGGSLGKINDGDAPDEVLDAVRSLKDGSYSTKAVKSSQGYHIVYKTSQAEKPELTDELTTEIKDIIANETAQSPAFQLQALKVLRERNEMKFIDTNLGDDFESLVSQYEAQYNSLQ